MAVVLALVSLECSHGVGRACTPERFETAEFPAAWIAEPATPEDVEASIAAIVAEVSADTKGLPPAALNDLRRSLEQDWLSVKAQLRPGDQLWRFRSTPETWAGLYGREGYVLVRNCRIVSEYVLIEN